jgi:hypothetical protein
MVNHGNQSANFKQAQRKQIIYFHVNRYIIWIYQRFVKQNKVRSMAVNKLQITKQILL